MAYVKKNSLPGGDKRVTHDPMEATYIGIHMWAQAVEQAKSTTVDAVRQAIGYQHFKAPSGFDIEMDAKNHHLHKPVFIGEIKADGQFNVVWKTDGPIRALAWLCLQPYAQSESGAPQAAPPPAAAPEGAAAGAAPVAGAVAPAAGVPAPPAAAVTLEDALRGLGNSAEDALGEAVRRIGAL